MSRAPMADSESDVQAPTPVRARQGLKVFVAFRLYGNWEA
jgi:hypothetical protein